MVQFKNRIENSKEIYTRGGHDVVADVTEMGYNWRDWLEIRMPGGIMLTACGPGGATKAVIEEIFH